MKPEELVQVIKLLNPQKEPGRLTLITRYGVDHIEKSLPGHIIAAQATGEESAPTVQQCH